MLIAAFCLVLLNAPSAKLLYSSELVNVLGLSGLIFFGFYDWMIRGRPPVPRRNVVLFFLVCAYWGLIFSGAVWGASAYPDATLLLRYLGAFAAAAAMCLLVRPERAHVLAWMQAFWGGSMTILYVTGAITLDRSLGQHYLTLGVPLAAGFIASMGLALFANRRSRLVSVMIALNGLMCFAGTVSLLGRAPVLLSTLTLVASAVVFVVTEKRTTTKAFAVAISIITVIVTVRFLFELLQGGWWQRLAALSLNVTNESRIVYYSAALDTLSDWLLGLGVGGFDERFGAYPHNIFLESALVGGILTLIPLLLIVCWLGFVWVRSLSERHRAVAVPMIAVYLCLTWNVSFDLGTSHIPLGYAILAIASSRITNVSGVHER